MAISKDGLRSLKASLVWVMDCETRSIKVDAYDFSEWLQFVIDEMTSEQHYYYQIKLLHTWVVDCHNEHFTISASDVYGWLMSIIQMVEESL